MYQPAFTEIFVVLLVVVGWARWLDGRAPSWAAWLPWGAGAAVVVAQAVAGVAVITNMPAESPAILASRWLGMAACGGVLLVEAGLTVASFRKPS